jgi:hypothetical protein
VSWLLLRLSHLPFRVQLGEGLALLKNFLGGVIPSGKVLGPAAFYSAAEACLAMDLRLSGEYPVLPSRVRKLSNR